MLTEEQRQALIKWYGEKTVVDEARRLFEAKKYERLEDFLHKTAIMSLSRHDKLPDYMLDASGKTLFPTNLDPRVDQEIWQDAIEVSWEVMSKQIGVSHDDIHRNLATYQERDWEAFIESIEQRKRERGLS